MWMPPALGMAFVYLQLIVYASSRLSPCVLQLPLRNCTDSLSWDLEHLRRTFRKATATASSTIAAYIVQLFLKAYEDRTVD